MFSVFLCRCNYSDSLRQYAFYYRPHELSNNIPLYFCRRWICNPPVNCLSYLSYFRKIQQEKKRTFYNSTYSLYFHFNLQHIPCWKGYNVQFLTGKQVYPGAAGLFLPCSLRTIRLPDCLLLNKKL